MKFRLILVISTVLASAPGQTGSPAGQTAALFGRVLNAQTGEPIRRAAIKIYDAKEQWDQLTDGDGRFRFPPLKRSEYGLITHRDGFTDRAYRVELSDFDDLKELSIELFPRGIVTGKVVDGFEQPLQGAQIQALPTQLRQGDIQPSESVETNDLGEYRLSGLDPGTYKIRATYRDGRSGEIDPTPLSMATSIYGGSEKPVELLVKAGSVIAGIDFVLNPVKPATIRGTLHTERGLPVDQAALWITGRSGEGGHNGVAKKGAFEIRDVGPGSYTISADSMDKAAPRFGVVAVDVREQDVNNLDLVMRPSTKIEGKIQLPPGDSTSLKPLAIYFVRSDRTELLGMKLAHPDDAGSFEIVLNPGEYALTFGGLPDNFSFQRVTLDNKAITNWKLSIEPSAETKKLVIVLAHKGQP